jgi:hypothetical protein
MPGSKVTANKGKFMPPSRISDRIDHIGLLIKDRDVTWKFYSDAFGFTKEGDGSKMAIPGSADRFENSSCRTFRWKIFEGQTLIGPPSWGNISAPFPLSLSLKTT